MKKIAITGHSGGLGKAVWQIFSGPPFLLQGYSRSNGWDIYLPYDICEHAKDCDVFINNAYGGWQQIHLLHRMHEMWHDQPKMIVNISSSYQDRNVPGPNHYTVHKAALDKAVHQLQLLNGKCKVVNVKFGKLENIPSNGPKNSFHDAAAVIYNVVTSPIYISSITVTPYA